MTSTLLLAACGGRYRTELVGHGDAMVVPRGTPAAPTDAVAAPGAGGIQLAQGSYELAIRFDIPRAQVVEWNLVCPGVELDGAVGEPFEQYRTRRIAELRLQRERDRQRMAAVTSTIVGAITPSIRTHGHVATPAGHAEVHAEAHVSGAVGNAVAAHAIDEVVELPPGDVGRGSLGANVHVNTAADGVCTLRATADDADIRATFKVIRVRDLRAEARHRKLAATTAAAKVRARMSAQLVSFGADAELRRRRLDEARLETEAKVRVEVEARAQLATTAMHARYQLMRWLAGTCNAEPGRRQRLADEERRRREARLVAYAELAQRHDQMALRARTDLRAFLIALGATPRPPRPAPLPEDPGSAPFDGARWSDGYWSWTGGQWHWTAGGWSDPVMFGETGGGFDFDLDLGADGGGDRGPRVRDHRDRRSGARIRDHRNDEPTIRDHRNDGPTIRDHRDPPTVRDHRGGGREELGTPARDRGSATVRDHRDDSKRDKDDDKPRVRDHR